MSAGRYGWLVKEIMRAEQQAKADEIALGAARDAFFAAPAAAPPVSITVTVGGFTYTVTAAPSKSNLSAP